MNQLGLLALRVPSLRNPEAEHIAEALGDLPLAIEQAAYFCPKPEFRQAITFNYSKNSRLQPVSPKLPQIAIRDLLLPLLRRSIDWRSLTLRLRN